MRAGWRAGGGGGGGGWSPMCPYTGDGEPGRALGWMPSPGRRVVSGRVRVTHRSHRRLGAGSPLGGWSARPRKDSGELHLRGPTGAALILGHRADLPVASGEVVAGVVRAELIRRLVHRRLTGTHLLAGGDHRGGNLCVDQACRGLTDTWRARGTPAPADWGSSGRWRSWLLPLAAQGRLAVSTPDPACHRSPGDAGNWRQGGAGSHWPLTSWFAQGPGRTVPFPCRILYVTSCVTPDLSWNPIRSSSASNINQPVG